MSEMTDARAVEVLAAMREDGGVVSDADYTAAIDRAVARLREPVGVGGEWVLVPREPDDAMKAAGFESGAWDKLSDEVMESGGKWPYSCRESADCVAGIFGAMIAAAPQPPAEAQVCGCGEATCVEPWEPGCGLGSSAEHTVVAPEPPRKFAAEAQAQGGGEVVAHGFYDPATGAYSETQRTPRWLPAVVCTAPPSAPVGVGGIIATDEAAWALSARAEAAGAERDSDDNGTWWTLRIEQFKALAQQPAAVDEACVDWRAMYRFQTAMRYMDNDPKLTKQRAGKMADDDVAGLESALAAQQGGSDNDR